MKSEEVYQNVTERIMTVMKQGCLPWRTPWSSTDIRTKPTKLPLNVKTNRPYNGVNTTLLWVCGFDSPYWGTEKTWIKTGASVKVGEIPTTIFFTGFRERSGERMAFFRNFDVYNLDQVEGLDHLRGDALYVEDYSPADELVKNSKARIVDSQNAVYDVGEDTIYRPPNTRFKHMVSYYTTLLHELSHWTGHKVRLGRTFGRSKDTPEYAAEELVAELATSFVAARLEIPERLAEMPNHASYIRSWLNALAEDNKAFFRAASQAQKAANYLMRYAVK